MARKCAAKFGFLVWCALLAAWPDAAFPQTDSMDVVPGPRYQAGPLQQFLLGKGYRALWTRSIRVPVLDLSTFAGGLTPEREGGGSHTQTLHLSGADGKSYVFRSVDKSMQRGLPAELQHTPVERFVQDGISSLHPAGALAVPVLLQAAGVLHVQPAFYFLPDDPRLGEFRSTFANMLGLLEERPDDAKAGTSSFPGYEKIISTAKLKERLNKSARDRVDSRAFLGARLLDFIIGDTDRTDDQWRWAGVEANSGHIWRPIPRDRDWAFLNANGALDNVVRMFYSKLVTFDARFPSIQALTFSSFQLDRDLLIDLPKPAWDTVVAKIQTQLRDDVLTSAVNALPAPYSRLQTGWLDVRLRERRNHLAVIADAFYARLVTDVDIRATDDSDEADIERLADGSVRVRVFERRDRVRAGKSSSDPAPYFERRFLPHETNEIRLYLLGGDDRAIVRGAGDDRIQVRVVGGPGDDVLLDSEPTNQRDGTSFYDDDGVNSVPPNKVDRKPFRPPETAGFWFVRAVTGKDFRDWGRSTTVAPALVFRHDVGLILGLGWKQREYGFRRIPYKSELSARALIGLNGGVAVEGLYRYKAENALWGISTAITVTRLEPTHFYGFGNDTPEFDSDDTRVDHNRLRLDITYDRDLPNGGKFALGPEVAYTTSDFTDFAEEIDLPGPPPRGTDPNGLFGIAARADLRWKNPIGRQTSASITTEGAVFPLSTGGDFNHARLEGVSKLFIGARPLLALRVGGVVVSGDYPFYQTAYLGGRRTLRGFSYDRFAGSSALYGGAELRVPVPGIHWKVGLLGLADAGRVFFDGDSPGGWHHSAGGGVFFQMLEHGLSVTYARGEKGAVYFSVSPAF